MGSWFHPQSHGEKNDDGQLVQPTTVTEGNNANYFGWISSVTDKEITGY